jgi:hypothetical protein
VFGLDDFIPDDSVVGFKSVANLKRGIANANVAGSGVAIVDVCSVRQSAFRWSKINATESFENAVSDKERYALRM